jgi:hypothetical protein
MRKLYSIFFILIFLGCRQPDSSSDTITEQEVMDFIKKYDEAWNTKDTIAVDKLIDNTYIYFSSTGSISKREESMSFLKSPDYRLTSADRSEVEIFISGNIATVSSHWVGKGFWKTEVINDNQRCGMTLQKINKVVKIIAEHCVEIKQSN